MDIKLLTNRESLLKTVRKPNFKSAVCFCENLMGCKMGKPKVTINMSVYLGQAILDLSKLIMYEFHYDYMIPKYKENINLQSLETGLWLCDMDSDSLVYHIKMEDFYANIARDVKERFNTSGFTEPRRLPMGENRKIIWLMKDELGGKIMTAFVTLRPKSYAYGKLDNKEDKKCEGIKKCVVKKTIGFDDYKNCLLNSKSKSIYRSQLMFRNNMKA